MPAEPVLREVVGALEGIERLAGSEGEREAAEWIAARLEAAGARATVDQETFRDGFAGMLGKLAAAASVAGGGVAATGRFRAAGAAVGAGVAALIADDISNGFRPWRKAVMPEKTTTNVVAELGAAGAERTLVVLGHHDAARSGQVFDPTVQRLLGERFPGIVERIDTSLPQWWGLLAGPLMVAAGSASGRRSLTAAGAVASAVGAALMEDIQRSEIVPGANDQPELDRGDGRARRGAARAPGRGPASDPCLLRGRGDPAGRHLRVLRPAPGAVHRERTWVLNLDTVGSPGLVLLEGEGPVIMEDFFDVTWRATW